MNKETPNQIIDRIRVNTEYALDSMYTCMIEDDATLGARKRLVAVLKDLTALNRKLNGSFNRHRPRDWKVPA